MDEMYYKVEIEDEPFEEHLIEEDPFENNKTLDCCLCPEGSILQNLLVQHIQLNHQNESCDEAYEGLRCCNCNEGIKLQLSFINHLLSHLKIVNETITSDLIETKIEQDEQLTPPEPIRSKPSYNNRFNRRDRSPETQNIISNFMFDEITKLYHCNFCNNGYKHKQTVERHLSKEHDPRKDKNTKSNEHETIRFRCTFCSNGYKHKQTLERHYAKEHGLPKATTNLKISQATSTTLDEPKNKIMTCDYCGKTFTFRESLRKHIAKHIDYSKIETKRRDEKIVCHLCPAITRRDQMKRHIQTVHNNFRPFICQEFGCTTTFTDTSKMNDHRNWHLKIKNYTCEFCQEKFYFASNWRQHLYRHVDPERYKCEICLECFVSRGSLTNHIRVVHEGNSDSSKSFVCDYDQCNKSYRFEKTLKVHITNVHREKAEHKCSLCSFVTTQRKYFKQHMSKVHQIREGNPRNRVFPSSRSNF